MSLSLKASSGSVTASAPAPAAAVVGPKLDGRLNRSVVTRKKIVTALTALVEEGHVSPTAEQVAVRAEVGLRTVFRHFDDMDSLYREISQIAEAHVTPVLLVRLLAPTWKERVLESIELRSEVYDRVAAHYLAAQVHRHQSPYLAQNIMAAAKLQRDLLKRLMPPEATQDKHLLEALDLTMSLDAWVRLRREQGLTAPEARQAIRLAVSALLALVA
jgi:AcrR family transcriptional regulator